MANVTEVTVRVMRKVKPRDYESFDVEVGFNAQLADDEDHVKSGSVLVADARQLVENGLTNKVREEAAKVAEEPKKKRGRPAKFKEAEVTVEPSRKEDTGTSTNSEIPTEDTPIEVPTEPSNEVPTEGTTKEVPSEPVDPQVGEVPPSPGVFTAQDLKVYVVEVVKARKIDAAKVKEILAGYNATRTIDLTDENAIKVKKVIGDLIPPDLSDL